MRKPKKILITEIYLHAPDCYGCYGRACQKSNTQIIKKAESKKENEK